MPALILKYKDYLQVDRHTPIVSLAEGATPLLPAPRLSAEIGAKIFLKLEGQNPTGSFKDRGMTMAVSKAAQKGARAIVCASTGNTSASAAAYAARAGLACVVLIPAGKVAQGKLAQVSLTGAVVVQIDGNFDRALHLVRTLSQQYPLELVNSLNPFRIEGQMTAAFEIVDTLGEAPDFHAIPVGNAGNITAHWAGYRAYHRAGKCGKLPRMLGFQASGAAPIVLGHPVEQPETIASAIRIGHPASWQAATVALQESKGGIEAITDEAILEAYRMLCSLEGVFCEPASAISVAGCLALARRGQLPRGATIACSLTGHGLKDPQTAIQLAPPYHSCGDSLAELVQLLDLQ